MTWTMAWGAEIEWVLGLSFASFFMSWSFANTLFYGETRLAVDAGVSQAEGHRQAGDGLAASIVSTIFIVNSALGAVMNGFLALVLFSWLELDVEVAFKTMAGLQFTVTVGIFILSQSTSTCSSEPGMQMRLISEPQADGLH